MNAEPTATPSDAPTTEPVKPKVRKPKPPKAASPAEVKPTNPSAVKKAIQLGKDMQGQPEVSKADIARKMYETLSGEPREVVARAFVEGAGLTPKGSVTYYYNCKRKAAKGTPAS